MAALKPCAAACVAFLLSGCASVFEAEYFAWEQYRPPAKTKEVVYSDYQCARLGGEHDRACSTYDPVSGHCVIYVHPAAPAWHTAHEERHCKGERHP